MNRAPDAAPPDWNAEAMRDADRRVERRLLWKELAVLGGLAVLVVLRVVLAG
jgi:hypothetical protein